MQGIVTVDDALQAAARMPIATSKRPAAWKHWKDLTSARTDYQQWRQFSLSGRNSLGSGDGARGGSPTALVAGSPKGVGIRCCVGFRSVRARRCPNSPVVRSRGADGEEFARVALTVGSSRSLKRFCPAVATLVDVSGLIIYFSLAKVFMLKGLT